jgi:hypothetical protein
MFERELMMLGLRRQLSLLGELIEQLERKPGCDSYDCSLYDARTKQVAKNLRKLRKIKNNYLAYRN